MVTFSGAGATLILPSPQLGDRERLNLRFVYKRMMNGVIRSYRMGPPLTTLEIEFRSVNRPKILEVVSFVRTTAGHLMNYRDYRNVLWRGVLLDLPYNFTHEAIRNNTFTLTFEVH